MEQRLISFVFSFWNEEETLEELITRVQKVSESLNVDYEFIFVNDASTDRSLDILQDFSRKDSRFKIINLSRRFGYGQGFMAGMRYAQGDAVITMDADLQDPPEVVPELIKKWREGADIVHTIRTHREGESMIKTWVTGFAYRLIGLFSNIQLLNNAGSFKLISRRVVDQLVHFKEKEPYFRGLVAWTGFKQDRVYYKRAKRFAGKAHCPILRSSSPSREFISGITSFSVVPLIFILVLGIILFLGSLVAVLVFVVLQLTGNPASAGHLYGVLFALFSGIQFVGLGLLGLYIGRIWDEVAGRPNYIVENTMNL